MANEKQLTAEEQVAADAKAAKANKTGKLKPAENPEEDTAVKLKPDMWIKGTGASKHLVKGAVHKVPRISGDKLISKGAAEETTEPKPKVAPKKAAPKTDEEDE